MKKKDTKTLNEERYISRRQFLIGSASTALMLPTLVSMLPKGLAQNMLSEKKLRLCLLPTEYGMRNDHLLGRAHSHPSMQVFQAAPRIRYGALSQLSGDISYIVDSKLTPYRNQMNLYNGLDLMSAYGHNFGGFSGSIGGREPNVGRSIDVIIEQSAAFKKNFKGSTPVIRQINHMWSGGFSYDRKRDAKGNFLLGESNCVPIKSETNDGKIFNSLFAGQSSSTPVTNDQGLSRRQLLVDSVLPDYTALKNHRRISGSDKSLLDQYVNTLHEIESNLQAPNAAPISCGGPAGFKKQSGDRGEIADWNQYWKNMFAMVVAAFACDQSRIYCGHYHPYNSRHHDIDGSAAENYGSKHQKDWINLMVDNLIKPLKEIQDPFGGGSLLDNTLVVWHNEHEGRGHAHGNVPVMTFGGFGGRVRTGYFMDFKQDSSTLALREKRGFPMKMMLVSILEAMGVSRDEILREGDGNGFGSWPEFLARNSANNPVHLIREHYDLSYFASRHSSPLPFFTNT